MKPFIPDTVLPTTVVGSYPAEPRRTLKSLFDPFHQAVIQAVDDQISAGITIISDGQVRGDMIGAFTSKLPGVRGSDVIGRVNPPDQAITVRDTGYAISRHPHVKAIITGPSTLAYGLHLVTKQYRDRDELILDIASALVIEAKALAKTGAIMLQIDEPIFSTGAVSLETGREAIQTITDSVDIPVCLHACGQISGILDTLLAMPVRIFDFEGTQDPDNLASFSGKDLKDKYIGYGVVDSASREMESEEVIEKRLWKGIEILGPERILADPDCGLRMHQREEAFIKLSRLTGAVRKVRDEL